MARKNAYSSWLTAVKKALIPTSKNSGKKPQIDEETSKKRDRRRWSFRKSQSRQQQVQVNPPSPEKMAAEEAEVATTTAVRLTKPSAFKPREYYAAVIIQTVFRGYLARRALRALKGLVKLQALVRGRNVRRKTNTILQSMKAFVRVQDKFSDDRRIRHFPSPVPAPFNGHKSSLSCADNFWDPRFMNRRSDCNLYHKEEEEPPEMTWLDQWMASRTSISNRNRGRVTTDLPFSDTTPLRRPCYNNHHLPSSPTTPKTPSTPNYMTATESAMARLRSRSVQRQSPERERAPAARKRLSFPAPEPHSRNRVWSPRYGMMTRQMSNVSSSVTESFGGEISPASTADLRRWLR